MTPVEFVDGISHEMSTLLKIIEIVLQSQNKFQVGKSHSGNLRELHQASLSNTK